MWNFKKIVYKEKCMPRKVKIDSACKFYSILYINTVTIDCGVEYGLHDYLT